MHIYISQNQADAYLCGLLSRLQVFDDPDDRAQKLSLGDRRAVLIVTVKVFTNMIRPIGMVYGR